MMVTAVTACLKYLVYVLRHKYFVFKECMRYGLVWRGLVHDWTKFLPSEFFPYAYHFNTEKKDQDAFDCAWNYHQNRNEHHWQFWLLREDDLQVDREKDWAAWFELGNHDFCFRCLEMPDKARKEMLADWRGAGMAQGKSRDDVKDWYINNRAHIFLHKNTRAWVEKELGVKEEKWI